MDETIMVMQLFMQELQITIDWMFSTEMVPGLTFGIVLFGGALITMGTKFVSVMLSKKTGEKDA